MPPKTMKRNPSALDKLNAIAKLHLNRADGARKDHTKLDANPSKSNQSPVSQDNEMEKGMGKAPRSPKGKAPLNASKTADSLRQDHTAEAPPSSASNGNPVKGQPNPPRKAQTGPGRINAQLNKNTLQSMTTGLPVADRAGGKKAKFNADVSGSMSKGTSKSQSKFKKTQALDPDRED